MPKMKNVCFYVLSTHANIHRSLRFVACILKCTELIFFFRGYIGKPCVKMRQEKNALKLFTFCIHYLTNSLLGDIYKNIKKSVLLSDIEFVITVPAIWDDTARMFMIEASKAVRKIVLFSLESTCICKN